MLADLSSARRVWAVLATKPRKEEIALILLGEEGFEGYQPKVKNRHTGPLPQAMFPGYLFVHLSPMAELAKVRYFPGVLKPLIFGEGLACVEPELIERWREREGGRGYLCPEPEAPFRVGQRVRFQEGVFAGMEGTVLEAMPSKDRVRLLLEYLGGALPVEADRNLLK
ncbi:MAG: transcription termination/antitermination protein NusG [Acidobacteriota bacterium]